MRRLNWGKGLVPGVFDLLRWLVLACLMAGAASSAFATKTYSDNGDGTVTDPTTGLQWMRCSMGQTWDGTTCNGTASSHTWDQANAFTGAVTFAGQSDWRLPNIRELQTIVDRSVSNPAIDTTAFPNTYGMSSFWSASAYASYSDYMWVVNFNGGYADYGGFKYLVFQVRLVRAGQSFGLLDIARPSTDYVDQGNGTVTHTPTRLMWQRCAVGQSWTGSTCSGSASTFSWDDAKLLTSTFAGQTDWRLPTEEELVSLVDYSRIVPAINTTLFPNTLPPFWSASADAYNSDGAWLVGFYGGNASSNDKYYGNQVRLVRAGLCLGPLTLTVNRTGTGQVTGSVPPGGSCDPLSGSGYYSGDVVTVNATPAANLISWGGACSGSAATCIVTMDAAKTVTASFKDTPLISGLPSALTFAPQNIGSTSVAQSVTLTNSGTAALAIASITASGDYGVTHNCGSGLGVSGFCTLNITFSPTATGTRTGAIAVTDDAFDSPQIISLTGNGQGAVASLSATSKTFANQDTGSTSAAQSVTLTNTGGAVLNIASIVASRDFAQTTTCGASLGQAANCSISITFTPTAAGARSGSIVITSDATSSPDTISLSGTGVPTRLINISTRGQVQTGNNVMIGGFIIQGAAPKTVLIRAGGPSMASSVTGVLANPMLELHRSSDGAVIATNDDWGSATNAAEITATTLAPVNSKEAAILATLAPGAYTAIVTGNGGGTGVGIVEVYDIDHPEIPLINISTRGQVQTGSSVMIGGFIIQGDSPQTVLIRAVGPNLANYGVTGVLADPMLELHRSSDGAIIASNDNWGTAANAAAIQATGLAPMNPLESAILITLPPGAYTAIVSGANGGTGVGIVEVFAQ